MPLAPEKIEGPCQVITYLGIEIDSVNMVARLPKEKLIKLNNDLRQWGVRKKCRKRDLLSLIGSLSFACKVVKPGRMFLRRLIDLSCTVKELHYHITVNRDAQLDIAWWKKFLVGWNGVEIIQGLPISSQQMELYTDASGEGLGGFYDGLWFSTPIIQARSYNIAYLELLAIVIAVFCWGHKWTNKQIVLGTDNEAIVHVWCKGSCKDRDIMVLIRNLFYFTAKNNINLLVKHIPGKYNVYADLLSRLQVGKFKEKCPKAAAMPTAVPDQVWKF